MICACCVIMASSAARPAAVRGFQNCVTAGLSNARFTAVNRIFSDPTIAQFWDPFAAAGRAALDAMITQQAQIIAYIDDYKLLMIATLLVIPLLIVFKRAPDKGDAQHTLALE